MGMSQSERSLRAEELCQALAVEIGSEDYTGNAENVPSIRTVLSCCQGLVVVVDEGLIVRPVHYTLKGYLISHCDLFQKSHSAIAETCLTYLNSQQIMALSASRFQSTERLPFLEYSALYWGAHMKRQLSDCGKTLALKLFRHYNGHISIQLLLKHTFEHQFHRYPLDSLEEFSNFTGLHCASMFGLVDVARALIETDSFDVSGMDEAGATPLIWAARNGHEGVVQLLLGQEDVDPYWPDSYGKTPISWAAENGHEAVVKLLLGRKSVSPGRPARKDRTRISRAARNGCGAVLEPVNPSVQSVRLLARTGRTAVPGRAPGTDRYLGAVRITARDGRAGPADVAGGAIFRVTPDDRRALQIIGEDYIRGVRRADDG